MQGRIADEEVLYREHKRKISYRIRRGISGILGHTDKNKYHTSTEAVESEVYWPGELLPNDFPNIRIFTYGYDSQVTQWFKGPAMRLDVYSYGESLLNGLEARRREDPHRPLIFIVHSLGGLILKDVCILSACRQYDSRRHCRSFAEHELLWMIALKPYINRPMRYSSSGRRTEGAATLIWG